MERKIEGLLLSKTPLQDRHLIGKLLLRNGKYVSVLFYGGQGGGKKKKSSILEVGHMLKVELSYSRSTTDLYKAREWASLWFHKNIRNNHKAFYLMCLFLEVSSKLSLEENLHDEHKDSDRSFIGLFRVLSNALLFLDQKLITSDFNRYIHFLLFLGKLLIEQGVFPQRKLCQYCDAELASLEDLSLIIDKGGFSCASCVPDSQLGGRFLWKFLGEASSTKYQEFQLNSFGNEHPEAISNALFQYFLFQFQLDRGSFKSLPMVL